MAVLLAALFIARGMRAIEVMDFRLPNRAERLTAANDKHLNSHSGMDTLLKRTLALEEYNRQAIIRQRELTENINEINFKSQWNPRRR